MKAILMALIANIGVAIAKFVAFLITHSTSMLAESIHSLADTTNQILLLVGAKTSTRKADKEHPFGYGRTRYFYSFLVAIMLFLGGGIFSLFECYTEISNIGRAGNDELESPFVAIIILLISVLLEGIALHTSIQETKKIDHNFTIGKTLKFVKKTKSAELPVVLLEDTAAIIGLIFALLGIFLTYLTENPIYDALGSGAIGLLLVSVAGLLGTQMASLLIGESASDYTVRKIEGAVRRSTGQDPIYIRTSYLSPEQLLIAIKIDVREQDSALEITKDINKAEKAIRKEIDTEALIFIEPDIRR